MRFGAHVLAWFLFGSTVLLADEGQRFRAQVGYVSSISEIASVGIDVGADDALGVRLSFEHLFRERLGLELGLATSEHEFTIASSPFRRLTSEFRMTPLTAVANWHLREPRPAYGRKGRRVDLFVGGGLAYVFFGDVSGDGGGSSDQDLTWTAQFGLDAPLSRRWSLGLAALYLDADADSGGRYRLPVETISVYAGISLHR